MSYILSEEEKPSLEELALEHYGVLGMKWGQRKKGGGSAIRTARRDLSRERSALNKQAISVLKEKDIKGINAAKAKLAKMEKEYAKNPQRVLASRMTRGEKAVALIITGPFGLIPIAGTSAVSRRIERKQETGAYDKK